MNNYSIDLENGLPYRWFIIDDYSETESYMMVFANHAFADGVALAGLMQTLADNFDATQ